jgi:osmoprotectant transport system permease protein
VSFIGQVIGWFLNASHWQGDAGIPHRLGEHVAISAISLLVAAAAALPIGIILGHFGRFGNLAINISNVGRAIPSFALLVLAVEAIGIGAIPAFIALVALGIPPIVTNSYLGMREVDPDVREAAVGMGMRGPLVLWRVELPIALPFIMAGVRTSAVNIVATATLAALVAWGGLGRFIVDGFGQQDYPMMYAGAILVAVLALIVEFSLAQLQRAVTPAGLRVSRTTDRDSKTATSLATG